MFGDLNKNLKPSADSGDAKGMAGGPVMRDVVSGDDRVVRIEGVKTVRPSYSAPPRKSGAVLLDHIKSGRPLKPLSAETDIEFLKKERSVRFPDLRPVRLGKAAWGRGSSWKRRLIIIATSLLVFGAGAAVYSIVFSRADLTVHPKVIVISVPLTPLAVDAKTTSVNLNSKRLPGIYIENVKTLSKNFEVRTVGYTESRARGFIVIYNNFSESAQTLVKTTRFQSKSTGYIFRIQETAVVPGMTKNGDKTMPGSVRAEVLADAIGAEYNIGPDTFTIPAFKGSPKFDGFFAKSEQAFSGGLKGAGAAVSAEELKTAEEAVTAEVFEQAKKELASKVPPGYLLLPGAREIKITKVSKPNVGEAVRNFAVSADALASAIVLKESDLYLLLSRLLLKEENKEEVSAQKSDLVFSGADLDFDSRTLSFNIAGKVVAVSKIDPDQIKKKIAGKPQKEAEVYLRSRQDLTGFVINLAPFWLRNIPTNPERIKVKLEI